MQSGAIGDDDMQRAADMMGDPAAVAQLQAQQTQQANYMLRGATQRKEAGNAHFTVAGPTLPCTGKPP